ncbi:hypothetical protein R1flu_023326 [Riccia fluitans]|uniref:Shwachman-Bodian-Diamond syndrome protein n=1 Tax=Riccia fluitans TaxID=41844 RepID=A0ABD1XRR4_9MARC
MSRSVFQPIGQKRLTNIAVVRLKKHGNRFEIACYKNKVLSWRSRVEKDIDEVLQTQTVFSNVSKGVLAKSKDLIQAFGTDDHEKICLEILEKGELQVADKEREAQLSSQFRDIATIVMHKTVNPESERPYTISMIERLMKEVHFAVDSNKNSKQQSLELIRELTKHFPITRARMRLKLVVALSKKNVLLERLSAWSAVIENQEEANKLFNVVCQIEPGHFRECDILVRDLEGRLEVASMAVQKEGEGTVDDFLDEEEVPSKAPSKSGKEVVGETSIVTKFSESFSLDGAVFGGEGKASKSGASDGAQKESQNSSRSAVKQLSKRFERVLSLRGFSSRFYGGFEQKRILVTRRDDGH